MRYSRVLLLNPRYSTSEFGVRHPSPGLGYLAESLKKARIDYRVLDMGLYRDETRLWRLVETYDPDIVGASMMTYMYQDVYGALAELKSRRPHTTVVAGGPHVSCNLGRVLEECASIDYGFVLESERSFVDFCLGAAPEEVGGVVFRQDGEVVRVPDHPPIVDLDTIPFPTYDGFELDRYGTREIIIVSSRGCPYRCTYCTVSLSMGRELRLRSPENVADEIEYWTKRGCRQFTFGDDNFTLRTERVWAICDAIEARNLPGLKLRLGNGVRADKVDRPLLERMRSVGFKHIAFGVEGGNDRVLAALKKSARIERIERAIADACDLGYDVTLFFLVGSPGETLTDVEDSIRLAEKYPVLEARFFNLIPYPNTELFDYAARHELFLTKPEEYLNRMSGTKVDRDPVFQTPEMPTEDRRRALAMCEKARKGILRRAVARKFRRLVGLRWILAWLCSIDFVESAIRRGSVLRRLADRVVLESK